MLHWYTAVSTLAIAVLLTSHVLLKQRLNSCLHEAAPESSPRRISAADLVKEQGSSMWCRGGDHTTRLCRFKNLCYLPQYGSFAFFHHDNASVISGVPTYVKHVKFTAILVMIMPIDIKVTQLDIL